MNAREIEVAASLAKSAFKYEQDLDGDKMICMERFMHCGRDVVSLLMERITFGQATNTKRLRLIWVDTETKKQFIAENIFAIGTQHDEQLEDLAYRRMTKNMINVFEQNYSGASDV